MGETDDISLILTHYPATEHVLKHIELLRQLVGSISSEPFFEPKTIVSMGTDNPAARGLIGTSSADVLGFISSVAGGTRVRMSSYEEAIFRELANGGLVPAAVLIRSHMETAGLAALAFTTLADAARSRQLHDVEELVRQVYFGTSLALEAKHNPEIPELLGMAEQTPIRPGKLIAALDKFVAADGRPNRARQRNYALLCEYAHPSMRVTKGFYTVLEEHPAGWVIKYNDDYAVTQEEVAMCLTWALDSMRIGHGASAMLGDCSSSEVDGDLVITLPSPDHASHVWKSFFQQSNG